MITTVWNRYIISDQLPPSLLYSVYTDNIILGPHFLCWILGVVPFNTWLTVFPHIVSDHVFSSIAGFCHVDSREPTFCGFGWAYTIFYQSKWGYRKASKGLKIHSKLALSKSINATKS